MQELDSKDAQSVNLLKDSQFHIHPKFLSRYHEYDFHKETRGMK